MRNSPCSGTDVQTQAAHRSPSQIASAISPHAVISPATVGNAYHRGEGRPDHISNATLSPFHASTTESILSWPQFAEFGNLIKERGFSVFHLESMRAPLTQRPCMVQPYMPKQEVENTVRNFERGINFWYPTMTRATIRDLQAHILSGTFGETTRSCLSLLMMALGCACGLVGSFAHRETSTANADSQRQRRLLGELYFDNAFRRIYLAQAEFTADAVQALFFTGWVCLKPYSVHLVTNPRVIGCISNSCKGHSKHGHLSAQLQPNADFSCLMMCRSRHPSSWNAFVGSFGLAIFSRGSLSLYHFPFLCLFCLSFPEPF